MRKVIGKSQSTTVKRSGPVSDIFRREAQQESLEKAADDATKEIFDAVKKRRSEDLKLSIHA